MKVVGYVLDGIVGSQKFVDARDLEDNPQDYNIDVLYNEDDDLPRYAVIIWRVEDGLNKEELVMDYRDAPSLFPDNPLFIKYYDSDIDSLCVHFNSPEDPLIAFFFVTSSTEDGDPDQIFLLEDGKSCNLSELKEYILENRK